MQRIKWTAEGAVKDGWLFALLIISIAAPIAAAVLGAMSAVRRSRQRKRQFAI
jgi:hypothetical protein